MKQPRANYHSYLLRLWRSGDAETAPWQIMLENPHTGERHTFTGLPGLLAFLREAIRQRPAATGVSEGDGR
jgi:hypothetical protein